MAGMSGGSMLRARRKDVNVKPNRKLDRKSSRGMLYENEELRLRTININAEVERGQSDIKKLKRENEQLRREISALRYEYDRLDHMLREARHSDHDSDESGACCSACNSDCEEPACRQNSTNEGRALPAVPEEDGRKDSDADLHSKSTTETECGCSDCRKRNRHKTAKDADAIEKTRARDAAKFPKTSIDVLINDNAGAPALAQTSLALAQSSNFVPQAQTLTQNYPSNYFVSSNPVPGFVSSNVIVNDLVVPFSSNSNIPFVFNNGNNFATINADGQRRFHTGGNVEDLLSDMESVNSSQNFRNDYAKNSVFMCNTRKIIQQKMVQNIIRENVVKTKCPCSCGEKKRNVINAETPAVVLEMTDTNGQTSYVTEKNIELHYDYPRAMAIPKKSPSPKPIINESLESIASTNFETNIESEIVQTTTEVNSTILMFERKKRLPRHRRFDFFSRSHSAPEGDSPEPIYATVKKLPKKLKKLNLTNLENEVIYQLPSAQNTEIYNPSASEYLRPNVVINTVTADRSDRSEHKEELETINENIQDNIIETISTEPATSNEISGLKEEKKENPKLKKRRRFSLHFKKRVPKVSIKEANKAVTITDTSTEKDENSNLENRSSKETDRLIITNGHSPPVQAETKTVNHNTACKHRKKSITGHELTNLSRRPSNFSCREKKIHMKGDRRSHSLDKTHEPFTKSHSYHPVKHYFKQDSYQEMTTSHSEHERTNSLTSSLTSACSAETHHKSRGPATPVHGDSIPWCGCWGNSCL